MYENIRYWFCLGGAIQLQHLFSIPHKLSLCSCIQLKYTAKIKREVVDDFVMNTKLRYIQIVFKEGKGSDV